MNSFTVRGGPQAMIGKTTCPQHAIGFDGNVAPNRRHNAAVAVRDFYIR